MSDFPPLTEIQLEHFVSVLEQPEASHQLKALAEHLIKIYFSEGASSAGREFLRLRARGNLAAFIRFVFLHEPAAHHLEMIKVLEDPRRKRTMIVAPPGSGKSSVVSIAYPLFEIGRSPNAALLLIFEAYSQGEKINSLHRPILKGEGDVGKRFLEVFPEVVADTDNFTKEKVYVANRTEPIKDPSIFYAGATSNAIQGSRASGVLLDDLVGPDKVRSPTEMDKVRESVTGLIIPRLVPDGRALVVMTRWASSDLAELLLLKEDFEMLYMPAITDDPRGAYVDFIPSTSYLRYPQEGDKATVPQWVGHPDPEGYVQQQLEEAKAEAEADGFRAEITTSHPNYDMPCVRKYLHADNDPCLWPELFSKEALEQKRQANPVSFRLVYNGDPTGISGDIFKREWFRTYGGEDDAFKTVPVDSRIFMSVDLAAGGKGTRTDYFIILVVAVDQYGNKFIIDCYRDKILFPQQRDKLISMYKDLYPQTQAIVIEATNYQAALPDELATHGLPVISVKPIKKKELRIESSSVYWQQGKVFLPHNAPWKDAFVDEHTQFPRGKHDDQIDAGAQLFEFLSTYRTMPEEMTIGFG